MSQTRFKIDGMSCGHCVRTVKKTLEEIDGVKVAEVSPGGATVEHDGAVTAPELIANAITAAGYPATLAV